MEDDNLLDEEILVQETQDVSPTEFSRNLINRLGFSSQQHGAETVSLDNENNKKGFYTLIQSLRRCNSACS